MSAKTVFISYRREPVGESLAGRLTTELKHQGYDVFLDVTSMRAGPFSEQIEKEVQTRSHFILVVTPNSLERCSRPDDWIRREFELAVKHKRNIVPVVADSADWSTESGHLEKLSGYQRQILKHDSFQNDVSELIVRFLSLEVPPLDLTISSDKTIRPPGTRIPPSHWRAVTIGFIDYLRLKASRIQMFEQWPGLSQPLVRGFKTPHYEFASRGTLVSPNKRVLIVNGPAGAGKTTYIDQLSKQLIKRTPNPDVDLFVHLRAAELEEAVKQSDYPVLWQLIYSFFSVRD